MTEKLSEKDKVKMKEVFNETPEEALKREMFWRDQQKQDFQPLPVRPEKRNSK